MLEDTKQRFKIQLQKEVTAQSQMALDQYEKEKNPFYELGKICCVHATDKIQQGFLAQR